MGGLLLLQCPEQHIQRTAVLLVLLPHIGKIHHVNHGLKVLLILWRFVDEVEHERGVQRNLSLFPEGVVAGGVAGRSVLDEVVDEGQHIFFTVNVGKGVVSVGLAGVDQVEHPDFVALRRQQSACRAQQLAFGICDKIGAIRAVNIGLAEKPGLAGAGAAHYQNIHVALGDVAVHAKSDVLGQNNVGLLMLVIHILPVQFLGTAPLGAAVLLAWSPVLPA